MRASLALLGLLPLAASCEPVDDGRVFLRTQLGDCFADVCLLPIEDAASDVPLAIEVAIVNGTDVEVAVDNVALSGDPAFSQRSADALAPAHGLAIIALDVVPRGSTTLLARLALDLGGAGERRMDISVAGRPAADASDCDFGVVTVGEVGRCSVAVRNLGVRDLIIDSVVFDGDADLFRLAAVAPSSDEPVPPGAVVSLEVLALPAEEGPFAATLRLLTNVGDLDATLAGSAVRP